MAKKRANGEGCIRKRKDGRWEARYMDIFEPNPKKRRKSIMGKSRKEVSDKLVTTLYNLQQGRLFPMEASFTVSEWFDQWMQMYGIIIYKDTTYSNYMMIIKTYIFPHIGNIRLFLLMTKDIQKMFNSLYLHGNLHTQKLLSSSTLYKIRNVLSKGLQQAVINRIINLNPVIGLVLPPLNTPEVKFFNREELLSLSKVMSNDSFSILIAVLLETGLRIGELLALKENDINFEAKILNINKAVSYTKNKLTNQSEFIIHSPKTQSSLRNIHIMPNLEMLLKRQMDILKKSKEAGNSKIQINNLLFPSLSGDYQLQDTIRRKFQNLQKNLNFSEIKDIHSLRHSFVVNALNSGVSIQNVAAIIGHKNGSTTLKFYAHYLQTEAYNQLLELDKFHVSLFNNEVH